LPVWLTTEWVINRALNAQSAEERQAREEAFLDALHAIRYETAVNQSLARQGFANGIRNDAASLLLSSGQFFSLDRAPLAHITAAYLTEGELVKQGSGSIELYLGFLKLEQDWLDNELAKKPIMRDEMEKAFREVRGVVDAVKKSPAKE
jgi:hypothetical protein